MLFRINAKEGDNGMPMPSIKSALPHFEEIDRFPCLITGMPALATMNETKVEILKLCALSPPVPQRSMAFGAKSSSSGLIDNLRNSRMKIASSSCVSPFSESALRKHFLLSTDTFS